LIEEDDNFTEVNESNNFNFSGSSNKNKITIIAMIIHNEAFLSQINQIIKISIFENKDNSIFIYGTKLLINLFAADSQKFKLIINDKEILHTYLYLFEFACEEINDEFSVYLIFEILVNYFRLISIPLLTPTHGCESENVREIMLLLVQENLKKFLNRCKNIFSLCPPHEIKITIIKCIGILGKSFSCISEYSEFYIQEVINSAIIGELIDNKDMQAENGFDYQLNQCKQEDRLLHLQINLLKVLECLTAQSALFVQYSLYDLKIINMLNSILDKFNKFDVVYKIVKKYAFKLLFQLTLASGSNEDINLLDCILIKDIENELILAHKEKETGFINYILNILSALLSYEDPYISNKLYSKGLLIALFELKDEDFTNNLLALELLIIIVDKLISSYYNLKSTAKTELCAESATDSYMIGNNNINNLMKDLTEINAFEKYQKLTQVFETKFFK